MPSVHIISQVEIKPSPRVMLVQSMFDLPQSLVSCEEWNVDLTPPEQWNIGVIVGPSGCGKTTIAKKLFLDYYYTPPDWPEDRSIIDAFPDDISIQDVVHLLSSVGFSSPPAWLRPFRVLSVGEQFRATVARAIAERSMVVMDEFTSTVDRTVAQIGSAAVARVIRERRQQFVAVTCHYDVLSWLEPDWVYEPATNTLTVGRRLQRPRIELCIERTSCHAWKIFRKHHYLSSSINPSAQCFVAFYNDVPVAFVAAIHFPYPGQSIKREHRLVCLPDYQGIGIGSALSSHIASLYMALGHRYLSTTTHPGLIRSRARSLRWKMIRTPGLPRKTFPSGDIRKASGQSNLITRAHATFEYIGPPAPKDVALRAIG